MARAITRGHRVRVLGTEGLRARQGRPAQHSAVAVRSCNDLASPGPAWWRTRTPARPRWWQAGSAMARASPGLGVPRAR